LPGGPVPAAAADGGLHGVSTGVARSEASNRGRGLRRTPIASTG